METANTYRAIILGTTMLFGGCLLWLLISLNKNESLQKSLDQHRLKVESLTAEKLLADKALLKNEKLIQELEWDTARTKEVLAFRNEEVKKLKVETKSLSARLARTKSRLTNSLNHIGKLDAANALLEDSIRQLHSNAEYQKDSILLLHQHIQALQQERDEALIRSIQYPLIFTSGNDRLTTKLKRQDEFIAQLQLPSQLVKLDFRFAAPHTQKTNFSPRQRLGHTQYLAAPHFRLVTPGYYQRTRL